MIKSELLERGNENLIISNEIAKKIKNKKYLLQFLPEAFRQFLGKKYLIFRGKKIKVDYLIDIVSSLILKYYFKGDNRYNINSTILKEKYGYLYNYYIDYLVTSGIITLVNNYKKGVSSRTYSLNNGILKGKISRYRNSDKVLIKKYIKRVFDTVDFSESNLNLIDLDVKQKLILDLFHVDVNMEESIFFLRDIKDSDIDTYNRNLYSVDCIKNKHIFYHFDSYGRMHTNYTILKSFIRKNCLRIDGEETSEIDISNSQPLFLCKLLDEVKSNWVRPEEFELFKELTTSGKFYQYLMDVLNIKDRDAVKKLTYTVLFGKNPNRGKCDIQFKSIFPSIHKFIILYKRDNNDYRILSHELQKQESNLIFNKIIKKIMLLNPEIKIITIHDSIIVARKWRQFVEVIFKNELLKEFKMQIGN